MGLVAETCPLVSGGAVLGLGGDPAARNTLQTIRSWCGVPAAMAESAAQEPEVLRQLAEAWARDGRPLFRLELDQDQVEALAGSPASAIGTSDRSLERTVESAPDAYATETYGCFVAPVITA